MSASFTSAVVIGGAGFIGSNLVDALVARGVRVAIVDNLSRGSRANVEAALAAGATLYELDITEASAMRHVMSAERPEAVFHLAAQIDVHSSVADPARDAAVNVGGTVNLLEGARAAGTQRFVFASTGGAIYGDPDVIPTPETAPAHPVSPYGQSKFAAEEYCRLYGRMHGIAPTIMRYANVYGPRQDPHGEAGVVAIFASCLLEGRTPTIFGDGLQTRDYVYVGDVVAATLAAADAGLEGPYNVGCGRETSVRGLLEVIAGAVGVDAEPEYRPGFSEGVRRSCLDASRAARDLSWEPGIALEAGIEATVAAMGGASNG